MKRFASRYVLTSSPLGVIRNGFVEIDDDGTVLEVGQCSDPSAEENFLDGAIIPGMVNAHCHLELSSMHHLFRKGTGMAGFIDQINELRDTTTKEEKLAKIQYWIDTMWNRGVSAMADISNCDDTFKIKSESPMYTRTFLEVFGTEPQDCDAVMVGVKELNRIADKWGLDAAPCPHACYTMSPELVTAVSALGLESGFLSYHCEETEEEEEMIRSGSGAMWENRKRAGMSTPPVTGGTSLEYFIDRLLAGHPAPFEENILLVHEVCLTAQGAETVKKLMKHPYIAVCPQSNIFIHNQLPPIEVMRNSGITITVGTDSLSSNDDLDMIAEMYCLQSNFPNVPLEEIVLWATLNGASFLGRQNMLGSIEPGKKPGLVFVNNLSEDGLLTSESSSTRLV